MWIESLAGEKAQIDDADREYWVGLHGWSETGEPGDNDQVFVWMANPETGHAAPIAWAARDYWMGRDWAPSPPDKPVNPTKDPVLTEVSPEPAPAKPAAKKTSAAPAAPNKEA